MNTHSRSVFKAIEYSASLKCGKESLGSFSHMKRMLHKSSVQGGCFLFFLSPPLKGHSGRCMDWTITYIKITLNTIYIYIRDARCWILLICWYFSTNFGRYRYIYILLFGNNTKSLLCKSKKFFILVSF